MKRSESKLAVLIGLSVAATAFTGSNAAAGTRTRQMHASNATPPGRLFFIGTRRREIFSANPGGSDLRVVVHGLKGLADGVAVDWPAGHIYWTNMVTRDKSVASSAGSIQRADLDGSHRTPIIPVGGTFRPKQMILDKAHGKIYWSDREGMRVMRANLDGSDVETLIKTGTPDGAHGDPRDYCVGIALDLARGQIYWTQRGEQSDRSEDGSIRRANIDIPKGESPAHRSDVQVLFDGLPEPVDLALDLGTRTMYWTSDGGKGGNTVSRAPMDPPPGVAPKDRKDRQILVRGLRGGIGISLDLERRRMYFADLGGHVYSAKLDGSDEKTLLKGLGALTGIEYVEAARAGGHRHRSRRRRRDSAPASRRQSAL